jgi:hypothetical protein
MSLSRASSIWFQRSVNSIYSAETPSMCSFITPCKIEQDCWNFYAMEITQVEEEHVFKDHFPENDSAQTAMLLVYAKYDQSEIEDEE